MPTSGSARFLLYGPIELLHFFQLVTPLMSASLRVCNAMENRDVIFSFPVIVLNA